MWRRNSVASAASFYDMFSDSSSSTSGTTSSEEFPGFISVPFSAMNDENAENLHPDLDPWSQGIGKGKAYQAYRGQLKLAVYVNYGLLTVHVITAKHLRSRCKALCDSYVKMCVIPDQTKRTRCKTETVFDTNNPLYDEKFSFELLPEDLEKRLLITLWHRDSSRNQCEFLGCMTFGIHHIHSQKKTVDGWYYLLNSEVGKKKHLQVSLKEKGRSSRGLSKDVTWTEHHTISIKRKKRGFGFSLSGACPVKVSRVDAGSQAELAGLAKDDIIMRIDGLNVSRSSCDSVARIIKHAQSKIVLEIQRPKKIVQNKFSMETLEKSPRQPLCSSTPYSDSDNINNMDVSPCKPINRGLSDGKRALFTIEEEEPAPPVASFQTRDYGWLDMGCDDDEMEEEPRITDELLRPPAKDYGWVDDRHHDHYLPPDPRERQYFPPLTHDPHHFRETDIDMVRQPQEKMLYRETQIDFPPEGDDRCCYKETNIDFPPTLPTSYTHKQTVLPEHFPHDVDPLPDLIENHHNHYVPMHGKKLKNDGQYVAMHSEGFRGNFQHQQDLEWDSSAEHLVGFGAQTILPRNHHYYETVDSLKSSATTTSLSSFPSTVSSGYSTYHSAFRNSNMDNYCDKVGGSVNKVIGSISKDDSFIGKEGIINSHVTQEDRYSTIPRRKKVSFEQFS